MRIVMALGLLLLSIPASARRADPVENAFARVNRLIEKGDYARARDELDQTRAELEAGDPRQVRYHERTGAAWLREGDILQARAAFTAALQAAQRLKASGEHVAKAYAGMGLCLRGEGNDRYALRFFLKALDHKLDAGTRMFVDDQIREIEGAPPLPVR